MMFIKRAELIHYFTCFGYLTNDYAGTLSFHIPKENTAGIYITSRCCYFLPLLRLNLYVQKEGFKAPFIITWHQFLLFTASNRIENRK